MSLETPFAMKKAFHKAILPYLSPSKAAALASYAETHGVKNRVKRSIVANLQTNDQLADWIEQMARADRLRMDVQRHDVRRAAGSSRDVPCSIRQIANSGRRRDRCGQRVADVRNGHFEPSRGDQRGALRRADRGRIGLGFSVNLRICSFLCKRGGR